MKKDFLIIFCIVFCYSYSICLAQTSATISKPQIELIDNHFTIHYDILNSGQSDEYNISLSVRDSKGEQINARTLNGDIGENVLGGTGKKITWDLSVDSIYMEATLYFKIQAEVITKVLAQEKPVQTDISKKIDPGEDSKQANEINQPVEAINPPPKAVTLKRSNVVFSSLLFPGTGLSKIYSGKPYWIEGLVTYGCLGTSLLTYNKAKKTFVNYQQSLNYSDRNDYLATANKQVAVSNTLLISAISIWAIDFIFTVAGSKELKKASSKNLSAHLSVQSSAGNELPAPMLSFNYKF